jgi:putative hydrolase of the HAD superfamily
VFDIGGVLASYKPQEFLAQRFPMDKAWDLLHLVYLSDEWKRLDSGDITFAEARAAFTSARPDLADDINYVTSKEGLADLITPDKETEELVKRLKAKGKKIYLLSNYSKEGFEWLQERCGFVGLADGMAISSHFRVSKPNPAIYQALVETCGILPKESVFIDDSSLNVEAAVKEGFHGFVFEGAQDCENRIEELEKRLSQKPD